MFGRNAHCLKVGKDHFTQGVVAKPGGQFRMSSKPRNRHGSIGRAPATDNLGRIGPVLRRLARQGLNAHHKVNDGDSKDKQLSHQSTRNPLGT